MTYDYDNISRSSASSINVLLIFYMYDLNGVLLLNATSLCALSFRSQQQQLKIYFLNYNNICIAIITQI